MAQFTDDFVAGLKPRSEKYDEFENEEFGVRVFPNGTRTWLFTYEANGYRRFKTIGIFPGMSTDSAREALKMSRRIAEIDDGLTIREHDTLRFAKPDFSEHEKASAAQPGKPKRLLPWLLVSLATIVGAAAIAFVYLPGLTGTIPAEPLVPDLRSVRVAEKPMVEPKKEPEEKPATQSPTKSGPDPEEPLMPGEKKPRVRLAVASPADDMPKNDPLAEDPLADAMLDSDPAVEDSSGEEPETTEKQATGDPSVSRAQFASDVVNMEPVDRIGPTIAIVGEDVKVYFFTDIQNASGQEVVHVWEHDGREVARVPFDVKSNWRWRIFSAKRIKLSETGMWRVTVYDQDGIPIKADGFIIEAPKKPDAEPFPAEADAAELP